jgi:hypothetical protein
MSIRIVCLVFCVLSLTACHPEASTPTAESSPEPDLAPAVTPDPVDDESLYPEPSTSPEDVSPAERRANDGWPAIICPPPTNACYLAASKGPPCVYVPVACDDGIACTMDSCNASPLASCVHDASACECRLNTDCDDLLECNGIEACVDGACVAGNSLSDGTPCDDGDRFTLEDICHTGTCQGLLPLVCAAPACQGAMNPGWPRSFLSKVATVSYPAIAARSVMM